MKQLTYRVWQVPSKTEEGEFHRVWRDKFGRFHCDCLGHQPTSKRPPAECFHIKKVKKELRRVLG